MVEVLECLPPTYVGGPGGALSDRRREPSRARVGTRCKVSTLGGFYSNFGKCTVGCSLNLRSEAGSGSPHEAAERKQANH